MYRNFDEIVAEASQKGPFKVCVAAAGDHELLMAVKNAADLGFVKPVLVGDAKEIEKIASEIGLEQYELTAADSPEKAVEIAVGLVRNGEADILMKGLVNTSVFMRGVLNRDNGLRTGRLISLVAVYELEGYHKLLYCTDSGINTNPDAAAKKVILQNALDALRGMGIEKPKVAALAANEMVDPKIIATMDAKALVEAVEAGEISQCIIEGPIAFDVAFSKEAASHKGIQSQVSGDADLLVFPNIETGNVLGKSWLHFNHAKWAGIVLGAAKPVILGSRSDTAEIKINSIALACLASQQGGQI